MNKLSDKKAKDAPIELDIFDFIKILKINYFLIIGFVFIGVLAGITYLHLSTPTYTVSISLIPVKEQSQRNSVQNNSLRGLAGMIGISAGSVSGGGDYELYKALLTSKSVVHQLSKDQLFLKKFFSSEWDSETNNWKEIYLTRFQKSKSFIKELIGLPATKALTKEDRLLLFIKKRVYLVTSEDHSIATLSINIADPELGLTILNELNKLSDEILRNRSIKRTSKSLEFLKKKLVEIRNPDEKATIITKYIEMQNKYNLETSDLPFAGEIFGQSYSSPYPTKPNGKFILIGCFFISFLLAITFIIFRFTYSKKILQN